MNEPLSTKNSEVARLRTLVRRRRDRYEVGRFVIEGPKLVEEALAAGVEIVGVFCDVGWRPGATLQARLDQANLIPTVLATGGVERIASTVAPQPVVAEVVLPQGASVPTDARTVLVVLDLNDPGNVGTLARSALAAGFDAIVALGDTADPFGPKALRASAGAFFRIPVVIERDVTAGLEQLKARSLTLYGTRMTAAQPCDRVDLSGPLALIMGNEARGVDPVYEPLIDSWLSIPMAGPTESLNVAMAGTILTYEVLRQRRNS